MIVESNGKRPHVHDSAFVAATATLVGDVEIEEGCAVMHGAVLVAEGAPLRVGPNCVVMEQAVLRASGGAVTQFPLTLGEASLVGPGAYLVGCEVGPGSFVASGVKIFNGARLGAGCTVAVNAVVHIKSEVGEGGQVPIGGVVVGRERFTPADGERIDAALRELEFGAYVFNVAPGPDAGAEIAARYSAFLRESHAEDRLVPPGLEPTPAKGAPAKKPAAPAEPAVKADVGKVYDVTFYELEEMARRRETGKKRP
ncbi:MAG TPA: gamma carbonic anhydrase family protein [Candidatus Dormibacteraeota bacterium]|nr:gamma carbonic anhydrase family protein [Candidatus Dormibacteraeota bacterium]